MFLCFNNSRATFGASKMHLSHPSPSGFRYCPFEGGGYVVVDSLFIVIPIVCGGFVFGPWFLMQYSVFFLDLLPF